MRLLGAVLLWISLTCVGVISSTKLKTHITILEKTLIMLEEMKIQLNYLNVPIFDLLTNLSEKEYLKGLFYLKECHSDLEQGIDFPRAWKNSIENASHLYKTDEKERLLQLGCNLGASSTENQLNILDLQIVYFTEFLENAKNQSEKYGSTITALGVLSGCMVFILVI